MDIWKKLSGELIDIVEWLDDSRDTLVYRFQRMNNEIKNGAKLTVREGQMAVFVNEGKIADIFQPGMYTLETANLPILATLKGWKYGFNSPFKAEVYFVNTRQFTNLKWGTMNPVMLRDAEFGPLRLRAFGNYAIQVTDPGALVKEIAGTNGRLTVEGLTDQVRNFIVSRFAE
ncbi:MAG: SPFH domain-containing protein, partial [bacterium]